MPVPSSLPTRSRNLLISGLLLAGVGAVAASGKQYGDMLEYARTRAELLGWIAAAGLRVLARQDTRPRHGKAQDATDPLHAARAGEVTSLWRLGAL